MAKKLLISDNKLGWIRDTRSGVDKSPVDKIAIKTEKLATPSGTKKKSLLPEALIKATETVHKAEARKPSKPKAASKIVHAPKRPLAVKTSLVAPPPIKPLDRTPQKRQKIELAPQPETAHEPNTKASLFHQTYEAALVPIVEKPSIPIAEIPLTLKEAPTENQTLSKLPYLLSIVALICAAMLLPERYRIFVFLVSIFIVLMGVLYRLGKQYRLLKSISESRSNQLPLTNKK
jgi:hypothetical protein